MIILPLFLGLGPALGAWVKGKPREQRWLFAAMCFMSINGLFGPGNWGLTLASEEFYRGHAKGYHFYFNHILAIALITARWLEDRRSFRWVPPGMFLYALFIIGCMLSVVNAPRVDYVMMAAHKMVIFALLAVATCNALKTADDLRFFMRVMGVTMIWEVFIVLQMKYLQGIYQVRGTFEHQNPLSMYALMIGLPLLAVGLGPKFKGQGVCLGGFLACAIIVQSALSRAGLVMFAAGAAGVAIASLLEKPTARRMTVLSLMSLVGALGLILTLDTIVARFHDEGNTASAELREVLNEAAKQMREDHPLGIGWNNYALVINPPYPYAEIAWDWIRGRNMKVDESKLNAPVESHYYLLIGENGYPGLVLWLLVIGSAMWRNVRGFLSFPHGFERCLCLGILAGTSLNYVQSTLERVLTQPRNLMLWLILFGVTARLEMMRRARKKGIHPDAEAPEVSAETAATGYAEQAIAAGAGASGWPSATAMGASPPEWRYFGNEGDPPESATVAAPGPAWADVALPERVAGAGALIVPERPPRRRWWRKRRFWYSATFAVLLAGTAGIAWRRGQQPRIMIINGGEESLDAVTVTACGQTHVLPPLAAEETHRWIVDDVTSDTRVTLRYGDKTWTGDFPETLSGLRISLVILPDGSVDEQHLLSPWREWFAKGL